jgi:hypothetical protein
VIVTTPVIGWRFTVMVIGAESTGLWFVPPALVATIVIVPAPVIATSPVFDTVPA